MTTSLLILGSLILAATSVTCLVWLRATRTLRLRNGAKRFATLDHNTHLSSYNDGRRTIVRDITSV